MASERQTGLVLIRDATAADFPAILAMNEQFAHFLSPMDAARLEWLHGMATCHRVVVVEGTFAGFVIAVREGTDYDSPNYRWFAARYDRFLYIDRLAIGDGYQGRGLGRRFYEGLAELAASSHVRRLVAEYDVSPPNPASAQLHERFGFCSVGEQTLASGKRVSLQARAVEPS